MRAYYATYNDKVYQLADNRQVPSTIMNVVEHTHTEVSHMKDRGMLNLDIHISNADRSAPSNAELFDETVIKLKTDKTKEIDRLSSVYRVYAEYSLVDEINGCVVDDGICVNEINSGTFILPLGLTDANELVCRLGISLNARFEKCYRDVRPFGVTRLETGSQFTFYIKHIYVLQILMSAFKIPEVSELKDCIPYVDSRILPPHWNCTAHTEVRKAMADMMHPSIPSMMPAAPQINLTENDYIIIYDSAKEGLGFDPIHITYKPKTIHVTIAFTLLDILAAVEEDIKQVLSDNVKNETVDADGGNEQEPSVVPTPDESGSNSDKDTSNEGKDNPSGSGNTEETSPADKSETPSSTPETTTPSETTTNQGTESNE